MVPQPFTNVRITPGVIGIGGGVIISVFYRRQELLAFDLGFGFDQALVFSP